MLVRTRFAPSPTGLLHIGGARTALFAWAYAKHHGGQFFLRIEDTDTERNSADAVQAILDAMHWLNLDYHPPVVYQTQRLQRYQEVLQNMLNKGTAYYCYCTKHELEIERENQINTGNTPRYSGRCRSSDNQLKSVATTSASPVIRFKNPQQGEVLWHDLVKGNICVANQELDDLIIARSDGTPTYNFCVVVDDIDMQISHVIRGDDHISNTPRQINIFKALNAPLPQYAHLAMVYGSDGQKLSKRHGAVGVMDFDRDGYLPQALLNYLARLGFGHGDDEVFSMEQFCAWFDFAHISASPAQFDWDKLNWLNAHYIKDSPNTTLASHVMERLAQSGIKADAQHLAHVIALYKTRVQTLQELAEAVVYFYRAPTVTTTSLAPYLNAQIHPALVDCIHQFKVVEWHQDEIKKVLHESVAKHQLKFPQLAMLLRVLITGKVQTPSIDEVLCLLGREQTLTRLEHALTSRTF